MLDTTIIINKLQKIINALEAEAKYLDPKDEAISHIKNAIDVLRLEVKS